MPEKEPGASERYSSGDPEEEPTKAQYSLTEEERALLRGGVEESNVEAAFAAIAKLTAELTEGKPFRFKKGDVVHVRRSPRSGGQVEDDWQVHEIHPNGLVVVTKGQAGQTLFKELTWPELYAVNPE